MTIDPLLVDLYAGDLDGHPDLPKLIAAGPPWHGVMLKATQGTYYTGGAWFRSHWDLAKRLAGERYGVDWFRACYHYLDVGDPALAQADKFLMTVERAGGWSYGDLDVVIDVESAGQPGEVSRSRVEDLVSVWREHVHAMTGKSAILYGGSFLRSMKITNRMGCRLAWVARYDTADRDHDGVHDPATLPPSTYESIGFDLPSVFAWQYNGDDGNTGPAHYPRVSPIGPVDISAVIVAGGGTRALEYMRREMCVTAP